MGNLGLNLVLSIVIASAFSYWFAQLPQERESSVRRRDAVIRFVAVFVLLLVGLTLMGGSGR